MSNQLGSLKMGQKFKITPAGEIPVEWEVKTLEEVCDILDTQRVPLNNEERSGIKGNIPYYGANGIVDYINKYIFDEDLILIAEDGGYFDEYLTRPIAYPIKGKAWVNNHAHVLRVKQGEDFSWVYYNLVHKNILPYINGGTRAKLNQADLRIIPIPCPVVSEQKKVGQVLSSVDESLSSISLEIKKTKELRKGLMRQLLTRGIGHEKFKKTEIGQIPESWSLVTFGDAFSFLRNGSNSRDELTDAGDVGYVHYGDLHTKWQTKLDCSEVALPKIEARLIAGLPFLENGDLIMADASEDYAGVGVSVEIENVEKQKIVAGLHTMLLRDKTKIFVNGFRGYIQYVPAVHNSFVKIATGGSVYGISKSNVQTIKIPCPPHKEQEQIKGILAALDLKLKNQKIHLEKISGLKMSLMSVLLTGKVRVLK